MLRTKYYFFTGFFLLFLFGTAEAQLFQIEANSLVGNKNQLPFWLWANQLGRYDKDDNAIQHIGISGYYELKSDKYGFSFQTTADIDFSLTNNANLYVTQLFESINWKMLRLQIGAYADKERYAGLSTTNGNMASSRNARPHPAIRLGFNRFIHITQWLSVFGFYEEGLLNDTRYVNNTHLHRKALYLRFGNPTSLQITTGMEHFVMWGGTSPIFGELQGWDAYFDYIFGNKGDENSLMTDQLNVENCI
jgi:hypothetical protein